MSFLGVDGCRFGWFGILLSNDNNWSYFLSNTLRSVLTEADFDVCFIDIPISLSENNVARECDVALRKILPRNYKSSVFNPPVKDVLSAENYNEACQINQSLAGKKISIQSWNIVPKIREVNEFVSNNSKISVKLFETHPETFFFRLNNDMPLTNKKKTKEGRGERLEILTQVDQRVPEIYNKIVSETKRKELAYDDVLDAMVLAIVAKKFYPDQIIMLPDNPMLDSNGCFQNVFIPKRKSYLK